MLMISPRAMTTEGDPEPKVIKKSGRRRPRMRVRCIR